MRRKLTATGKAGGARGDRRANDGEDAWWVRLDYTLDDALEVRESEVYCSRPFGVMLRRQCGLEVVSSR